jgi:hypothetical protein
MKTIHCAWGCAALLLSLGLVSGCAGMGAKTPTSGVAEPAATTQAGQDEREPATLAEAEALLEKARGDLDRLALNESGQAPLATAAPPPAPAGAAAPSPAPMRAPQQEAERADKSAASSAPADRAGEEPAPAKAVSACEAACKAFSSLVRASDAVCRLDPDGGQRCERAKKIREDASSRVASCGCAK